MVKNIPIPLNGSYMSQGGNLGRGTQYFGNCYFNSVQNSLTGSGKIEVFPRPSFTQQLFTMASIGATGMARGIYYWGITDAVYAIWNTTLGKSAPGALPNAVSRPTALTNNGTALSTANATNGGFQFEEFYDGSTYTLLLKDDGGNLYGVSAADAVTAVSDGDYTNLMGFGAAVGPVVVVNGRVYALSSNSNICNSDLNSYTAWTSSNYLNAQEWLDKGVCLIRKGNLVGCFGTYSLEWFQDVGNPSNSPLGRVEHLATKVGCANHRTVKYLGESVYWLGKGQDVSLGVFRLNGYTPERISTPDVERWILAQEQSTGVTTAVAMIINSGGHSFYVLSVSDSGGASSMVFDVTTKSWHPWYTGSVASPAELLPNNSVANGASVTNYCLGNASTTIGYGDTITTGTSLFQSAPKGVTTGYVNIVGPLASGSAAYDAYPALQIGPLTFGSRARKLNHYAILDGQRNSGTWTLSVSDDGGTTYTSVGTFDMSKERPRIERLGSFFERYYRLEMTAAGSGPIAVVSTLHLGIDSAG